mmetsp:Transcript_19041/g.67665  ORF Transcript_19041/g.67665 Transcript_19041/m.67665 type:complete len:272 (-) Transcript_19041:8-823(-)
MSRLNTSASTAQPFGPCAASEANRTAPRTTVEMKMDAPSSPESMSGKSALPPPSKAAFAAKRSGAPLPSARSVMPATSGGSRSARASHSSCLTRNASAVVARSEMRSRSSRHSSATTALGGSGEQYVRRRYAKRPSPKPSQASSTKAQLLPAVAFANRAWEIARPVHALSLTASSSSDASAPHPFASRRPGGSLASRRPSGGALDVATTPPWKAARPASLRPTWAEHAARRPSRRSRPRPRRMPREWGGRVLVVADGAPAECPRRRALVVA